MKAIIDGNNVFRYGEGFNVRSLHALFKALDEKEIDWFCYTDANMKYLVNTHCNAFDRNLYNWLLEKYKGKITSVPAGRRADSYILQKADKEDAIVISNDKFRDFEYVSQYPWLMSNPINLYRREAGRCVYPFVFQEGRLQIYELDIYAYVDCGYNLSFDEEPSEVGVESDRAERTDFQRQEGGSQMPAKVSTEHAPVPFPVHEVVAQALVARQRESSRYSNSPLLMFPRSDPAKRQVESETARMLRRMSEPQKLSPLKALLCGVVGALVIAKGIHEW